MKVFKKKMHLEMPVTETIKTSTAYYKFWYSRPHLNLRENVWKNL